MSRQAPRRPPPPRPLSLTHPSPPVRPPPPIPQSSLEEKKNFNYFWCEKTGSSCSPARIGSEDYPRHKLGSFEFESYDPDYLEVRRYASNKPRQNLRFYLDKDKCSAWCTKGQGMPSTKEALGLEDLTESMGAYLSPKETLRLQTRLFKPPKGTKPRERPKTHVYPLGKCPAILLGADTKDAKGRYQYEDRDLKRCANEWVNKPGHIVSFLEGWFRDENGIIPIVAGRKLGKLSRDNADDIDLWDVGDLGKNPRVSDFESFKPWMDFLKKQGLWDEVKISNPIKNGSEYQLVSDDFLPVLLSWYQKGKIDNFLLRHRPQFNQPFNQPFDPFFNHPWVPLFSQRYKQIAMK
jgi:hypothetical protein